jgi:hypothetical protein
MTERSIYLRDQAEKCMRQAQAMGDAFTQAVLRRLASQYVVDAAEIERKEADASPLLSPTLSLPSLTPEAPWAYRRSRPPIPIDRDQCGAGADGAVG